MKNKTYQTHTFIGQRVVGSHFYLQSDCHTSLLRARRSLCLGLNRDRASRVAILNNY